MIPIKKMLFLSLIVAFCDAKSLPNFVTLCKANDPKINDCIKVQINNVIPKLSKGIAEHKILPIDPFSFIKVTVDFGSMHIEMLNGTVYGLDKVKMEKVVYDKDAQTMYLEGNIPQMITKATYDAKGNLLTVPIEGKGSLEASIEDAKFNIKIQLENFKPDSKKSISFVSSDFNYSYKNGTVSLGNLFNGNKELSKPINKLLSEENQRINRAFKPEFVQTINTLIQSIIKPLLDGYNYNDIFSK